MVMKKTMAMLLALVLMVGALALPASAADTVASRVYLDAPAQVTAGENAAVALYVNGNTAAGGVQGTITYNATDLTYQSVTLRGDVTALGNTEDVTVKVDGSTGTIKFVLLSNVTGGEAPADAWLTVNFTVNMTAAGASTDVSLSDVVVSNKTGEGKLSPTVLDTEVKIIKIGTNDYVGMDGATIKTDIAKQGIRFQSTKTSLALDGLTEAGVVILPAQLLYEGQDLTKETVGKNGAIPAIAKVTDAAELAAIAGGESLFATLTNGTTNGRANVEIVARAYVVVNGVTIYSHNDIDDKAIVTGEATKTLVGVAQSIAATEISKGATNTLGALLTKQETLSNDEVTTLLTFCRDNYSYL